MNIGHDGGNNKNKNKLLKYTRIALTAVFIFAGLYVFFNYILFWFLPFIAAWFISLMMQPAVNFFHTKLKLPRKFAAVLLSLFLFASLGIILFAAVDRIIYELNYFSRNFSLAEATSKITGFINNFFIRLERFLKNIPGLNDPSVISDIKEVIINESSNIFSKFSADIITQIPAFIKTIIVVIPKMLVFTLITIISTFYIALDFNSINKSVAAQIPPKVRRIVADIKSRFFEAIFKYIKAYFILFLIAYTQLAMGFLIIGVKYAFLIAFIIALIDMLPVLGTGTVLIPWGLIMIIQKDYFTGFGLLILYAVIMVVRNVIEPKIVGATIGLYPLVTLIAMFVGYNILGVAGIFLFPIVILILKNLNDEGKINIWKKTTGSKNAEDMKKK